MPTTVTCSCFRTFRIRAICTTHFQSMHSNLFITKSTEGACWGKGWGEGKCLSVILRRNRWQFYIGRLLNQAWLNPTSAQPCNWRALTKFLGFHTHPPTRRHTHICTHTHIHPHPHTQGRDSRPIFYMLPFVLAGTPPLLLPLSRPIGKEDWR